MLNAANEIANLLGVVKQNKDKNDFNSAFATNQQRMIPDAAPRQNYVEQNAPAVNPPNAVSVMASMYQQDPSWSQNQAFWSAVQGAKAMAPKYDQENQYQPTYKIDVSGKRTLEQPAEENPMFEIRRQESQARTERAQSAAKERTQVRSTTDWRFLQSMKASLERDLSQLGEDATKYGNAPTTSDEDKDYFGIMRSDIEQQIAERQETYRMVLARLGELKPQGGTLSPSRTPVQPQGEAVYDWDAAQGKLVPRNK